MTVMTQHGEITFPAFMPVTTFGDKYPLLCLLDYTIQEYGTDAHDNQKAA